MSNDVFTVSKPKAIDDGAESAREPRRRAGDRGSADAAPGLSARKLLVRGKGELPTPVDETGFESIYDPNDDRRTRILDTESWPWRMICSLRIDAPGGRSVGTGWFIGPRTVITAGHCVYTRNMGGWADQITVVPGRDDNEQKFGSTVSEDFDTINRWVEHQDPDFDYAAIHLSEPLGAQTGWFSVAIKTRAELEGSLVNVCGYPADRARGAQQWFHANRVLRALPERIYYNVDTYGGQSGSPVWLYDLAEPDEPQVVAIHAYGFGGTARGLDIKANSAPRITDAVFERLQEWADKDE